MHNITELVVHCWERRRTTISPSFEGNFLTQRHEVLIQRTRDSALSYGENQECLSHLGLNQYQVVTDGRTESRQLVRV